MGAVKKICKEMEITSGARDNSGGSSSSSSSTEIKSSSLSVDTSLPLPQMTPRVIELCKDLFKTWSKLDDSRFSVERVSGGITNLLLKVSVEEENGNNVSVTVRLYGPNTDYVINRERELMAIKHLSAAGFGAKLLGVFRNGMVQAFINARTLTPADIRKPKLAVEIAKQLRRFHEVAIPGSKEPQLWNDVFKFFEKASTLQFDDIEKQSMFETIQLKEVLKEVVELKDETHRMLTVYKEAPGVIRGKPGIAELAGHLNAPVVFAHNDLLSGNIMVNDEKGELYLIDFEYGSYNYRGYDIGNHFSEYAGYECDYSLYPNKDEQYHFFRHYLQPDKSNEVSVEDLESLYVEVNTFMLAAHLFWALWSLIQAKMSPIEFDYLGYFFLRYNEYKRQKEMCFSLAQSYLSKSGTSNPRA